MPRLSCLHVMLLIVLPAQQFALALQDSSERRQIPPAGVHELPASQRPTALSPVLLLRTPVLSPSGRVVEPQQSPSSRQISPVGWQRLGGWQISTPLGPYGKQALLQHPPPHVGRSPPS